MVFPFLRRVWPALVVIALLALAFVLLIRMSSPRQPGMPGTGGINYGTPVSPSPQPSPSAMPGMNMGAGGSTRK